MDAEKARKTAIAVGCAIMLAALLAILYFLSNLKETPIFAMVLIGITLFGFQFLIGNIQTLPSDYFNGKNVGTVAGMAGTAAVAGTLLTTWAVPIITKTSYESFFILAAVLVPLSWISVKYITSKKIKLNNI
jgi:ACS family hexuronate transporter-like MFS transporter